MSVTTLPLQLLDSLSIRVFLDTSVSTAPAWHVQPIERASNDSSVSTDSQPHITLDLVKTGGLDSIRIRTSLPHMSSPVELSTTTHDDTGVKDIPAKYSPGQANGENNGQFAEIPTESQRAADIDFTFDGCHDPRTMASMFTNHASSYGPFSPDPEAAFQMFMPSSASSTQGYHLVDGLATFDVNNITASGVARNEHPLQFNYQNASDITAILGSLSSLGEPEHYTPLSFPSISSSPVSAPASSPTLSSKSSVIDTDSTSSDNAKSGHRKRRVPCLDPTCSQKFTNEYTRKVHMNSHRPKGKYPCRKGCSSQFARIHDRLRHEVGKHNELTEWFCSTCLRPFSSERSLTRHTCTGNVANILSSNSTS